jgi:hypothetical protein
LRIVATEDSGALRVTQTSRIVALPSPTTAHFTCDTGPGVEWDAGRLRGTFDCDAGPNVAFTGDSITSYWRVTVGGDCDFVGTGTRAGRFTSTPDFDAEFEGRAHGPVRWSVDAPIDVTWIAGAGIVAKDCLAGDGRYAEPEAPADEEENYVF